MGEGRALQPCSDPGGAAGLPTEKAPFWLPRRREGRSFELPTQAQMEKGSTRV